MRDSGIKEGERIDIGRMEMKVNRAGEQEEEAKDNRRAMEGEEKQYNYSGQTMKEDQIDNTMWQLD